MHHSNPSKRQVKVRPPCDSIEFFHKEAQRIMKTRHQLIAPVSGQTIALGQVPDPIFSEKLTGDGLAILANSRQVVAPCDGTVTVAVAKGSSVDTGALLATIA